MEVRHLPKGAACSPHAGVCAPPDTAAQVLLLSELSLATHLQSKVRSTALK